MRSAQTKKLLDSSRASAYHTEFLGCVTFALHLFNCSIDHIVDEKLTKVIEEKLTKVIECRDQKLFKFMDRVKAVLSRSQSQHGDDFIKDARAMQTGINDGFGQMGYVFEERVNFVEKEFQDLATAVRAYQPASTFFFKFDSGTQ